MNTEMEVFSSNSCILSGNCVPPQAGRRMKRKNDSGFYPDTRDKKLPLKTFDSLVLSFKESTLKNEIKSTAELLDVQTAQPDDMWTLRNQLLGHSPHLSQEVLREMADRTDVFPDEVLLEILSANPDELKVDTLLLYLEQKEDPLPEYMISILYQVTNNISYRTVLKREIAQYHAAK